MTKVIYRRKSTGDLLTDSEDEFMVGTPWQDTWKQEGRHGAGVVSGTLHLLYKLKAVKAN